MKVCLVDEDVQSELEGWIQQPSAPVALLIGCSGNDKDYILDVLPTTAHSQVPIDNVEERMKKKGGGDGLHTLDEDLVIQHSLQITRMLAGGVDVLGLLVIAKSTAELKSCLTSLCPALIRRLHRALTREVKQQHLPPGSVSTSHQLWVYDMETKKYSYRIVDIIGGDEANKVSNNSEVRPLEVKISSGVRSSIHTLKCMFTLHHERGTEYGEGHANMGKLAHTLSIECCEVMKSAHFTLNHQHRPNDAPLVEKSNVSTGKGTKKGRQIQQGEEFDVDIFGEKLLQNRYDIVEDMEGCVNISGNIDLVGLVPHTSQVGEATLALWRDATRTLAARCRILAEDESVYEHESPPSSRYELPLRSYISLTGSLSSLPYLYSYYDYYEMGEEGEEVTSDEICQLISHLLADRHITPTSFQHSRESSNPPELGISEGGSSGGEVSEDEHVKGTAYYGDGIGGKQGMVRNYLSHGLVVLGLVTAVTWAYIYGLQ